MVDAGGRGDSQKRWGGQAGQSGRQCAAPLEQRPLRCIPPDGGPALNMFLVSYHTIGLCSSDVYELLIPLSGCWQAVSTVTVLPGALPHICMPHTSDSPLSESCQAVTVLCFQCSGSACPTCSQGQALVTFRAHAMPACGTGIQTQGNVLCWSHRWWSYSWVCGFQCTCRLCGLRSLCPQSFPPMLMTVMMTHLCPRLARCALLLLWASIARVQRLHAHSPSCACFPVLQGPVRLSNNVQQMHALAQCYSG